MSLKVFIFELKKTFSPYLKHKILEVFLVSWYIFRQCSFEIATIFLKFPRLIYEIDIRVDLTPRGTRGVGVATSHSKITAHPRLKNLRVGQWWAKSHFLLKCPRKIPRLKVYPTSFPNIFHINMLFFYKKIKIN